MSQESLIRPCADLDGNPMELVMNTTGRTGIRALTFAEVDRVAGGVSSSSAGPFRWVFWDDGSMTTEFRSGGEVTRINS